MKDTISLSREAQRWLIDGEHGISSRTLFDRLVLGRVSRRRGSNWPHDPDDFQRCERLLRVVPGLRERLGEMVGVHPVWAALVAHWQEIVDSFEAEAPAVLVDGWSGGERTPKTYALMRKAIDAGEADV